MALVGGGSVINGLLRLVCNLQTIPWKMKGVSSSTPVVLYIRLTQPLGRLSLQVAMSVCLCACLFVPLPAFLEGWPIDPIFI